MVYLVENGSAGRNFKIQKRGCCGLYTYNKFLPVSLNILAITLITILLTAFGGINIFPETLPLTSVVIAIFPAIIPTIILNGTPPLTITILLICLVIMPILPAIKNRRQEPRERERERERER
ncbi:MAG: hypothetical protein LBT50_01465 [Prevotellaceae bacterium]|nr:hypothetical protein [Prevotellaceae bacterium]